MIENKCLNLYWKKNNLIVYKLLRPLGALSIHSVIHEFTFFFDIQESTANMQDVSLMANKI